MRREGYEGIMAPTTLYGAETWNMGARKRKRLNVCIGAYIPEKWKRLNVCIGAYIPERYVWRNTNEFSEK